MTLVSNCLIKRTRKATKLTCKRTKTPPKRNAKARTPFLTKTPAQIPQTLPKLISYKRTDVEGGGTGNASLLDGLALGIGVGAGAFRRSMLGYEKKHYGAASLTHHRIGFPGADVQQVRGLTLLLQQALRYDFYANSFSLHCA